MLQNYFLLNKYLLFILLIIHELLDFMVEKGFILRNM